MDKSASPVNVLDSYENPAVSETKILVYSGKMNLYGMRVENNHTADVYLQIFDKAAAGDVTLGTTVATKTYLLPASGGIIIDPHRAIKHFQNGLVMAVTSTRTGSSAPGAAALVELQYAKGL